MNISNQSQDNYNDLLNRKSTTDDQQCYDNTTTQELSLYNLNQHNLNQQNINKTNNGAADLINLAAVTKNIGYNLSATSEKSDNGNADELHMAEKLVEETAQQNKNAFQFDTIAPKKNEYDFVAIENRFKKSKYYNCMIKGPSRCTKICVLMIFSRRNP